VQPGERRTFSFVAKSRDDESFEAWHSFCRNAVIGQTCIADRREFGASISGVALNGISLMELDAGPCSMLRRPEQFNDAQRDLLAFYFVRSGRVQVEQDGRSVLLEAGDAALCVGGRPFTIRAGERHGLLAFKVDRRFLSGASSLEAHTAINLTTASAIGPMVSGLAGSIWAQIPHIDAAASHRLVRNVVDIAETALGLNEASALARSKSQASLRRIKALIESNLSLDDLDPDFVASRVRMSSRYINKLFAAEGTSLSRYIWRRRIQVAAIALLDPAHASTSISEIAFSHGFNSLSHFSDMFRREHHASPTEFRKGRGRPEFDAE
jgi:AraC family transcriptional activator of tynA and feaB